MCFPGSDSIKRVACQSRGDAFQGGTLPHDSCVSDTRGCVILRDARFGASFAGERPLPRSGALHDSASGVVHFATALRGFRCRGPLFPGALRTGTRIPVPALPRNEAPPPLDRPNLVLHPSNNTHPTPMKEASSRRWTRRRPDFEACRCERKSGAISGSPGRCRPCGLRLRGRSRWPPRTRRASRRRR